jgi:hypothetical protein
MNRSRNPLALLGWLALLSLSGCYPPAPPLIIGISPFDLLCMAILVWSIAYVINVIRRPPK